MAEVEPEGGGGGLFSMMPSSQHRGIDGIDEVPAHPEGSKMGDRQLLEIERGKASDQKFQRRRTSLSQSVAEALEPRPPIRGAKNENPFMSFVAIKVRICMVRIVQEVQPSVFDTRLNLDAGAEEQAQDSKEA